MRVSLIPVMAERPIARPAASSDYPARRHGADPRPLEIAEGREGGRRWQPPIMAEGQTVSKSENSPWAPLLAALKMKMAVLFEGWIAAD